MDLEILKSIPIFSTIDNKVLEKQIKNNLIYMKKYSKGVTVHNANDSCHTIDIVLSGSLIAYSLSLNGSSSTVFEFDKDSIIGANLLFSESHKYPLNIYCLTDCQIIFIDTSSVLDFLHDYDFTLNYIKSISQNSQGINQKIVMFTQKSLRENLMDYFKQQIVLQKSNEITIPISKKQLADYFGVQRPSLFRELKKLKTEGIVEIINRKVIVKVY